MFVRVHGHGLCMQRVEARGTNEDIQQLDFTVSLSTKMVHTYKDHVLMTEPLIFYSVDGRMHTSTSDT